MQRHRSFQILTTLGLAVAMLCVVPAGAEEIMILGQGLRVHEATSIHTILERPDDFIGKTVRIEGEVLDVCPRKGCWAQIGDEDSSLRIKVKDDVIVFPADSLGRTLAAEGMVEAIEQTRQQHLDWLAHLAEERGETFDEKTAEIGDGPFRWIQIRGVGGELTSP